MDNKLVAKLQSTQNQLAEVDKKMELATAEFYAKIEEATVGLRQKKIALLEKDAEVREAIKESMEKKNVKKFENESFAITLIAASKRKTLDSKRLKVEAPGIYDKYVKESDVKSSIRITIKEQK